MTGASSGIGQAFAHHYATRGATLGLVARRVGVLDALAARLPGTHAVYAADVCQPESLAAAAADFCNRFGVPDIVIANAGVSVGTLTEERDDYEAFETVFLTNVLGMVASFRPFVADMRRRGSGQLVGISSVAGVRGLPGAGAYSASKAAVSRYLESLRVELRHSGVKVTEIRPGFIRTPMTDVNPYRMPFLLEVDDAVRRFAAAIDRGVSQATIPWQMAVVAKLLPLVPNTLYDRYAARARRKPRRLEG
ncbi:MAG: SDR family oxidoreductase [Uliginosibacterium sp.]|nr:SDR family oxidoreductase [Uliginosibacterium sp.]MBK9615357.1 SDR family oxidoreductase [Uliginosibacterium sp.]